MNMKTLTHIMHHSLYAAAFAAAGVAFLFMLATAAEPQLTHSQEAASSTFEIQQTITDESSFSFEPTDVVMAGSINGITGGQATGTTVFAVQTNNAAGYQVEIDFFDNATPHAMLGDTNNSESLRNYDGDIGGEPSRFYTASTAAQFAYTVASDVSSDTDLSFFHPVGAGVCGQGGSTSQADGCWKAPDVAAFAIVERGTPALTGATSTITFNITVPNAATPVPEADTYTATATLSLITL
jgi:hypothetical protein